MTTYNASKMAAGVQPKVLASGVIAVISTLAITVANAIATNDLINMLQLEGDPGIPTAFGPSITGVAIDTDQLDTGAGIVLALGDATTANRFITGSTIGQAGGYAVPNVAGTLGYQPFASSYGTYTTASLQLYTLVVKVTTGATTPKAGTLRVKCEYSYDA